MTDNVIIPQGSRSPQQYWRTTESGEVHTQHFILAAGELGDDILAALGAISSPSYAIDTVAGAADLGTPPLAIRDDDPAALVPAEGDWTPLRVDSIGSLWTRVNFIDGGNVAITSMAPGSGATDLGKAEDAAHASGDVGVMALAVQRATPADSAGADGDYSPLQMSGGRLWASVVVDTALPAGTNAIGKLAANSGVTIGAVELAAAQTLATVSTVTNLSQLGGAAVPIGAGLEATAIRVTLPTNGTGIVGLAAGTNAIGKLAANSGVDIGDVDVTSLVPGTAATSLGKAEDAVHATGDTGVMALAVRKDTAAALAGTDGDYAPLEVDANGRLHVLDQNSASALTALQLIDNPVVVDDAAFTPATTSVAMAGFVFDDVTPDTVNEGDAGAARMSANRNQYVNIRDNAGNERGLNIDASGNLNVSTVTTVTTVSAVTGITNALPAGTNAIGKLAANSGVDIGDVDITSLVPGTGATNLGKAIDAAAGGTDTGVAALALRDDALTTLTPVDGDYVPLRTDSTGSVWVRVSAIDGVVAGTGATNLGKAEDAAHSSGDTGVMALAVRSDTPTAKGADGDYVPLLTDSLGRLHVRDSLDEYETVAASQTAQALGATGAAGDYVDHVIVVPATTSPGNVLLLDNATSMTLFAGGASSVSNLIPFTVYLGMKSTSGAWKITTGANVSVIAVGDFT